MATEPQLHRALAFALTGERLPVTGGAPIVEELAEHGYDAARLLDMRTEAQQRQAPWPFPVPIEELRALGFARFDAALAETRRALGLDGLAARPQARRPLDRDEQRLSSDRPPHWG